MPDFACLNLINLMNLQNLTLSDRIKGAIVGHALGDALGLGAEFMSADEVKAYYPDGLRDFDGIIRDAHRCQWLPGETTNDTVFFTNCIESVLECNGVDILHIARNLKKIVTDSDMDIVPVFRACVGTPGWEEDPIPKAVEAWQRNHLYEATNDTIHRGVVAGIMSRPGQVVKNVREMTMMTNHDSRCVAATAAVGLMAYSLLHRGCPATYDEIAAEVYNIDGRTIAYLDMACNGDLSDFDLDDEESLMWSRKAMGAALWTAWHLENPEEVLYRVIKEGGDADTNASASCALAGLRCGYDALPDIKHKLVKHDYFCELADRVSKYVEAL